ncbi:MAG: serine/threonine-protein kinase [Planctomycetota bacterium]|nr:serine/threonine-protein kinase [Planctomycetota bacterium]
MGTEPQPRKPLYPPAPPEPVDTRAETVLSSPELREPRPKTEALPPPRETTGFSASSLAGSDSRPMDPESADNLLAHLVIDRGLATLEEVAACREKTKGTGIFGRKRTLAQSLVDMRAITPNQLARLEKLIETQRSGKTIPGFKMLGKLGKGTSATVYKARQLNLDRLVAIKVLPASAMRSEKIVQQFYAEGRAAAQLNHPNIVQAFDVGHWGDFHYFVMEFVEGKTVHEMLQERVMLSAEEALDITIAVAEALRHAHERGFVHRDVKPKNIILDPKGTPKLADLGLARAIADREAGLAEKGHALGTPYYISPEQVRGEIEIGPPADIYSLGATFFHMLTGVPPFTGNDAREVMNKHLHEKARSPLDAAPATPPGLGEVVEKMLHKAPHERYPDCELLLLDLRAWKAVFTLQRGEVESGRGG